MKQSIKFKKKCSINQYGTVNIDGEKSYRLITKAWLKEFTNYTSVKEYAEENDVYTIQNLKGLYIKKEIISLNTNKDYYESLSLSRKKKVLNAIRKIDNAVNKEVYDSFKDCDERSYDYKNILYHVFDDMSKTTLLDLVKMFYNIELKNKNFAMEYITYTFIYYRDPDFYDTFMYPKYYDEIEQSEACSFISFLLQEENYIDYVDLNPVLNTNKVKKLTDKQLLAFYNFSFTKFKALAEEDKLTFCSLYYNKKKYEDRYIKYFFKTTENRKMLKELDIIIKQEMDNRGIPAPIFSFIKMRKE